jgi:hypothetical protein
MDNPLLKFRSVKVAPPDKFQYIIPEDGTKYEGFDIDSVVFQAQEHYRRHEHYLKPTNLRELLEDQNCQRLSGEWCEYENGEQFMDGVDARFGIEDVVNGTKVLASFTLGGMETVTQEVAEERAKTCARCFMNSQVPGCSACFQLLNVVAMVKGDRSTKEDHALKSCLICKCSLKAAVWVPGEHLMKGTTPQQERQFERIPWCWKKKSALL